MQTNTVLHMLMALCALNEGETKVDASHDNDVQLVIPPKSPTVDLLKVGHAKIGSAGFHWRKPGAVRSLATES